MLVNSFALTLEKFSTRAETAPEIFFAQKWKTKMESPENKGLRGWTVNKFLDLCNSFSWNEGATVCGEEGEEGRREG
jgi:hypothetical protein